MNAAASSSSGRDNQCPVCLSPFTFPVELNCKHRLCYLCFKGVVSVNEKCPMCRKKISKRMLDKPKLLKQSSDEISSLNDGDFKWFYKGNNGWWVYDDQTNDYIENAFRNNQSDCQVSVVGNCYTINFNDMMQYRVDFPSKKRRIKRDVYKNDDGDLKGLAGISKAQLNSIAGKRKRSRKQASPEKRTQK